MQRQDGQEGDEQLQVSRMNEVLVAADADGDPKATTGSALQAKATPNPESDTGTYADADEPATVPGEEAATEEEEEGDAEGRIPTQFIIKGQTYVVYVGIEDEVSAAAKKFIQRNELSRGLLSTIERELHVTQAELFRRHIAACAVEIDDLHTRCEVTDHLVNQKEQEITELRKQQEESPTETAKFCQLANAATSKVAELELRLADLEKENASLQEHKRNATELIAAKEQRVNALQDEMGDLRRSQELGAAQLAELKQQIAHIQNSIANAKEWTTTAKQRASNAQASLVEQRSSEANRLQAAIEQAQEEAELAICDGEPDADASPGAITPQTTPMPNTPNGCVVVDSGASVRTTDVATILTTPMTEGDPLSPREEQRRRQQQDWEAEAMQLQLEQQQRWSLVQSQQSISGGEGAPDLLETKTEAAPQPPPLTESQQSLLLQQGFELYATAQQYNGLHQMTLTKFRRFLSDVGVVDGRKVRLGDLDVVYRRALTMGASAPGGGHAMQSLYSTRVNTTGGASQNERLMSFAQFHRAMQVISSKVYAATIERMTGKKLSMLTPAEREAALEAALEVFVQQKLHGFVQARAKDSLPALREMMQRHALDLSQDVVLRQLESQFTSLAQVYGFYSESQRAKTNMNTSRRSDCLTFKELVRLLTDFRVVPKLTEASHAFELWRCISARDADGLYHGIDYNHTSSSPTAKPKTLADFHARSKTTHSNGSSPRSMKTIRALLAVKPRADFITFAQFVELLGHVALEAMPHPEPQNRIIALFTWLDQSEGRLNMTRQRSTSIVRFSAPVV